MSGESEILNEGRIGFEVKLTNGKTEKVTIKKVGYRNMGRLAKAIGNAGATALLYIEEKKTEEWLDSLDQDSLADLVDEGDKVNFPLFKRWLDRQIAMDGLVSAKAKQKALEGVSPA